MHHENISTTKGNNICQGLTVIVALYHPIQKFGISWLFYSVFFEEETEHIACVFKSAIPKIDLN